MFGSFLINNSKGSKRFVCGHNIVHHDARYIQQEIRNAQITDIIDTLYLSPLLFPGKPCHALLKDDKLQTNELNNPLNDSIKAMELFYDEVNAFYGMSEIQKEIYAGLLCQKEEFRGFFSYVNFYPKGNTADLIQSAYRGKMCSSSDIEKMVKCSPIELAYALAMISAENSASVIPGWVNIRFPDVSSLLK